MSRLFRLSNVLFLFALFVIWGCDDDSNDSNPMTSDATTQVRVIHASFDAPAVDVSIDGSVAISDLAFIQSSGYAEITAGTRNVKVTPAGMNTPVVIDADLTLDENKSYTVYAVDRLAMLDAVVTDDDRTTSSSKAKVRFAHFSPDAPAVDIRLTNGEGPAVFANSSFKDVSDYVEVDAGTYTFVVTPAGMTAEVVVFAPIAVENGTNYTVIANGTLNAADAYDFGARVFVDNNEGSAYVDMAFGARAKVVHASPDAPGVDLLVDDVVAGTNLEFPNDTGYLGLPSGMRNIKVNVTGTSTTAIEADLDFATNAYYSIFAVDEVANIGAVVFEDDLTNPDAGNAHVRFIHLSPDAPAVDITTTDGSVVFGNVAFKENSGFEPLPAATYDLQVRLQGTDTVVLELPGISLSDGNIYTVFAKGFATAGKSPALGAEIILNK